jgi:hypothetical protein
MWAEVASIPKSLVHWITPGIFSREEYVCVQHGSRLVPSLTITEPER